MSSTPTLARPSSARPGRTFAAAVGYSAAWLAGLSVAAAGTEVTSSGADVVAALTGHETAAAAQYVLTEVVAAAALAVTVSAVAASLGSRPARDDGDDGDGSSGAGDGRHGSAPAAGRMRVAALVAAGLSTVQGVLGLVLALVAVPRGDAGLAGGLLETVNRTDGVKMFVLAAMAVLALRAGRGGALPRWLTPVAGLLAVTVAASGVGYLLLVPSFALAAYASLPLLLLWVTGAGVAVARRQRAGR